MDQSDQQIAKEEQGDGAHDEVFHSARCGGLKAVAETGVKAANDEEGDDHADKDQVVHGFRVQVHCTRETLEWIDLPRELRCG